MLLERDNCLRKLCDVQRKIIPVVLPIKSFAI